MWATERLHVKSNGDDDVLDLTRKLQDAVDRHHLQHGQVLVFVPGSTAGGGREREVVLQLSGEKS